MERKLIAAAVSSALALPMAAQAVELSAYGHVNRAIVSIDDGTTANDGDLKHVDSGASPSRFGFRGSEELDSGLTAGVHLEYGLRTVGDSKDEGGTSLRHANVYFSSVGGTLTMGQGSAATDFVAEAGVGSGPSWLGGVTNSCGYISRGPACPSNDGGRQAGLRYDTPAIGPAAISLSTADDDYLDAQLSFAGSLGDSGSGYALRIGHTAKYNDDASGDITTVSAAVGFGQGTNIAAAWSQADTGSQVSYRYLKLDHSYGAGSIGVYYKTGEYGADTADGGAGGEESVKGADGTRWGVGIGHGLGGGVTAYAGYQQITEDNKDDIDVLVAGMLVSFN